MSRSRFRPSPKRDHRIFQTRWASALVPAVAGMVLIGPWTASSHHGRPDARGAIDRSPAQGSEYMLTGVAASSARNAWAVGFVGNAHVTRWVILRWKGTKWSLVSSPNPLNTGFDGVATTSASNAWAVGATPAKALIEHWNGRSWRVVPTTGVGAGAAFDDVTAISARNAWAVGYVGNYDTTAVRTLIEHWNGKSWKRVASPSPRSGGLLESVTAISASDAWAVGTSSYETGADTAVIEHWNGTTWTMTNSQEDPGLDSVDLHTVAASSAGNAWAAGINFGTNDVVYDHCNGLTWTQVAGPSLKRGSVEGDAVFSAKAAWAVSLFPTRIARWNGTAWTIVHGANLPAGSLLWKMAGTSTGNIWAVGQTGSGDRFLIEHWNGRAWTQAKDLPTPSP